MYGEAAQKGAFPPFPRLDNRFYACEMGFKWTQWAYGLLGDSPFFRLGDDGGGWADWREFTGIN